MVDSTCIACGQKFNVAGRDPLMFPVSLSASLAENCVACYLNVCRAENLWYGLTCRFHWVAFTSRMHRHDLFDAVACAVYGCTPGFAQSMFHELPHGGNGYDGCVVGPHGVRIWYSRNREDCHVVIPGAACDVMSPDAILKLFDLPKSTFKRIDIAIDGVEKDGKPLSPCWLYDLCLSSPDLVRTRVALSAAADSDGVYPENLCLYRGRNGDTVYIGSKASDRRLRAYTKRGFCRMELTIQGDRLANIVDVFTGKRLRDLGRLIVGLIRGFVDFIEPSSRGHRNEAKLQPWWERVANGADKVLPWLPAHKPRLDESWMFFRRQWSAFAATALKAAGGDFDLLFKLVEEGTGKMTGRHEQMIAEAGGVGAWVPCWV